jgi:hypothetical protein
MKKILILAIAIGVSPLFLYADPIGALNADNAKAQQYLDQLRAKRAANDGGQSGGNAALIAVPAPVVQYIANEPGVGLAAVPYSPFQGTSQTVIQTVPRSGFSTYQPTLAKYKTIRASYGGIYPYTVVKARDPFVIVDQDNDVLVVGDSNPKRAVINQNPGWIIQNQGSVPVVVPNPNAAPVTVLYVQDRLDLAVVVPPGVPGDVVKRLDLYHFQGSKVEPTYSPNGKYAYPITQTVSNGTETFQVYRVNLP